MNKPTTVCMCGSTRFIDLMVIAAWEMEKKGVIVLHPNYLPGWYPDFAGWSENNHGAEQEGLKEKLDELHMRKIDMCDQVYIFNYNGYIGESTWAEVEYSKQVGKPIEYFTADTDMVIKIESIMQFLESKKSEKI